MRITSVNLKDWKSFASTGPIALDAINILVGRNNAGKSAFLRAVYLLQSGDPQEVDVRSGASQATVTMQLEDANLARYWGGLVQELSAPSGTLRMTVRREANFAPMDVHFIDTTALGRSLTRIAAVEPHNFFYPYLSRRKVAAYETAIDSSRATAISGDLRNLVAKIDRLASLDIEDNRAKMFRSTCERVFGFRISTYQVPEGKRAGISIGQFEYLPLEAMGEGVGNLLGLIVDLCMNNSNLYIIEELENDIHPEGLKAILEVILETSKSNQFLISTHSNVVVRWLGADPSTRIYAVRSSYSYGKPPVSTIEAVGNDVESRSQLLAELGYELGDFDLWDGWLFLEESSAERIIRDYLVRLFVPRLSRVRTLATGGNAKTEPVFEDFRRIFLFAHLEGRYRNRAWVKIDGDPDSVAIVSKLRETYSGWDPSRFDTWREAEFERYYPRRFEKEIDAALSLSGSAKRAAKRDLLLQVIAWCDSQTDDDLRHAFSESAQEVVDFLRGVDAALFEDLGPAVVSGV
ncbi:ATP-dependent nuclease [Blastococcus sp. SYSU DS0828]